MSRKTSSATANCFRRAFGHDFAAAAADFQARIKI
jgi:hypothetical protein